MALVRARRTSIPEEPYGYQSPRSVASHYWQIDEGTIPGFVIRQAGSDRNEAVSRLHAMLPETVIPGDVQLVRRLTLIGSSAIMGTAPELRIDRPTQPAQRAHITEWFVETGRVATCVLSLPENRAGMGPETRERVSELAHITQDADGEFAGRVDTDHFFPELLVSVLEPGDALVLAGANHPYAFAPVGGSDAAVWGATYYPDFLYSTRLPGPMGPVAQ